MRSEIRLDFERDDDAIVSATASWGENKRTLEQGAISGVGVLAVAGLMVLLFVPFLGLLLFAGAGGLFLVAVHAPQNPRAIVFKSDGRMLTPHGIANYDGARVLRARQDDVVSFEAKPMRGKKDEEVLSEVVLVTELGDLVRLSHNMDEEDAFKVAVTLTRALDAMRGPAAVRTASAA